ncbi:hypothetical protein GCM10009793_23100 [Brachybacterium phenoliresistens]
MRDDQEDDAGSGQLLHRREWLRRGVHPRQLASERYIRVFCGYFTPSARPATLETACRVLQNEVRAGAVISHESAAVLLGLALPDRCGPSGADADRTAVPGEVPRVHAVQPGDRSRQVAGCTLHASPPVARVLVAGIEVCHPYDVVCQLAPDLLPWDPTIMLESMVRPGRPGAVVPGLSLDGVVTHALIRASAAVAEAVCSAARRARRPSRSCAETLIRLMVRAAGFVDPELGPVVVGGSDGGAPHRVALGWPTWRVGIDTDHLLGPAQARRLWPANRAVALAESGWCLLRPTADDLGDFLVLLLSLRNLLQHGGAPAPSLAQIRAAASSRARRTAHRHP